MRNSFRFLFLCCVLTQQSSCSFVRERSQRTKTCQSNSTVKRHTLIVQYGKPLPLYINAIVLPSSIKGVSICEWTFNVDGTKTTTACNTSILKQQNLRWQFKETGLKTIKVAANFFLHGDAELLRNCTVINVTECSRQIKLTVTTSTSSFNVSKNHSEVVLDLPGMVNFSILVFNIVNPFNICHPLYYKWSFGDGQYLPNTADNKTNHFYNSSGLFLMVVDIFKDKDGRKFYKNISSIVRVKRHTLIVQYGKPSPLHINAIVLPSSIKGVSTCEWTFNVDGTKKTIPCNTEILKQQNLRWQFKETGLKTIEVAANFFLDGDAKLLRNCTVINVTECSRQIKLTVTTSTSSFNVSKNYSEVVLDSPGMVNFSILVFNIVNPFYICHPLYYKWSFGDGQYLPNTADNKTNHFYNSSGLFLMVVDIFKDKDGRKFYKNISLIVRVKKKPSSDGNSDTEIDVTLVLAILAMVIFVLVICLAIFRKRIHRFTEVARFDFRDRDFPSVTTTVYYKQGCCSRLFSGSGKEKQHLLDGDLYSSRISFGSALPTEEF